MYTTSVLALLVFFHLKDLSQVAHLEPALCLEGAFQNALLHSSAMHSPYSQRDDW